MSKFIATIEHIENIDNLNIVSFDFNGITLKMMSLDLSDRIKVGGRVSLNMKPTSVAIGKNLSGELSYSNKINAKIVSIKEGKLLCSIQLLAKEDMFESVITLESAKRMNLKINDSIIALIKESELSIAEVLV